MFIPLHGQDLDVRLDLNNQPIVVIWQGGEHRIREISNSYRVPSGSFETPIWREYFEIVTVDHLWMLIYHDLLDPQWKAEVLYD